MYRPAYLIHAGVGSDMSKVRHVIVSVLKTKTPSARCETSRDSSSAGVGALNALSSNEFTRCTIVARGFYTSPAWKGIDMNRRDVLGTLGATAVGLTALGAVGAQERAADRQGGKKKKAGEHHDHADMAAMTCAECMVECSKCMRHCIQQAKPDLAKCAEMCSDCSDCCACCAKCCTGSMGNMACEMCAKMCEACATECEKFADDPVLAACAKSCRECAKSCQAMAKH